MEASSGSAFLASCGIMDSLGPSIFWLCMLIGGGRGSSTSQNLSIGSGGYSDNFLSTGIGLLAYLQFFTRGSLRTPAVLRVASVTISLWRTVCTACKAPILAVTPSMVLYLTGGMTPWMIDRISLFVNNLCGEFLLLVSLSVIFLSFPSLV